MATYRVRSKGTQHTVEVVDNATGGATVKIEGCDETFQVEFLGGTGAEIAAANSATTAAPAIEAAPQPARAGASPVAAAPVATAAQSAAPVAAAASGEGAIVAPIPGKILSVEVAIGDVVERNQLLVKLEAMKMENAIVAPIAGTVQSIEVAVGAEVRDGQLLIVIG